MASQPYVPGAGEVYVGTGTAGALEFLGTTQGGPRITYRTGHSPIMADRGGPDIPYDMQYMGMEAFVNVDLVLFNFDIYTKAIARLLGTTFGAIVAGEIGSPILLSNSAYRLLIYWPYNGVLYPNMVSARNFPNAFVSDQTEIVSTKNNPIPLVWHCLPRLTAAAGAGTLVNTSTTGKPSPD